MGLWLFGGDFYLLENEGFGRDAGSSGISLEDTHISFDNSFIQPDLASKTQQLRRVSTSGTQGQQQCGGIYTIEASSVTESLDYQERNSNDGAHLD